jgi:hypothetical protein
MPVKSPKERVYYYECSYGKFRITYFVPFNELEKLSKKGKIKKQVLNDFPDGVDLRVEEKDYIDFEDSYDYRPELDPEVAKSIFFAILSSTKDWKEFRGSGIIPSRDLEAKNADIEKSVRTDKDQSFSDFIKAPREKIKPKLPRVREVKAEGIYRTSEVDLKRYRQMRKKRSEEQKVVDEFLEKIQPQGIDPTQTLQNQKFSKMQWTKGDKIEDVVARIEHKKQGGGESQR